VCCHFDESRVLPEALLFRFWNLFVYQNVN